MARKAEKGRPAADDQFCLGGSKAKSSAVNKVEWVAVNIFCAFAFAKLMRNFHCSIRLRIALVVAPRI